MLKKVNRLAKARDIEKAFARGRTFFNSFFTVKFAPSALGHRFTVVVSTKVFKQAVKRNRLKRIIREYIRKNLVIFKQGDYLVMTKPKISKLPENQLVLSFLEVVGKIK